MLKTDTKLMNDNSFSPDSLWQATRDEHAQVLADTFSALQPDFAKALQACVNSLKQGGRIFFFGNGGSAADAQHLAAELAVKLDKDRPALSGIALTTDTSTLTAAGNDYGFEHIFSRQLEALGRTGDIAIGLSTSGNSANVANALKVANARKITSIGLSGKSGGIMKDLCHVNLIVPSQNTARIQEMHIILGHMLCAGIEQSLNLV